MNEVTFEIKEHIGIIAERNGGWSREVNLVSWNGGEPKIDIRDWSSDHEHMSRGITLFEKDAKKMAELLSERYKDA